MALIVNAMTGDRTGAVVLVDAVKEAGHEEAGDKLSKLLCLHKEILPVLEQHRQVLWEMQTEDADGIEDLQARAYEEGVIEAFEDVLQLIGEEVPSSGTPGCSWCGQADATGPDGLCDQCRNNVPGGCEEGNHP
jgi:hypothetical protein